VKLLVHGRTQCNELFFVCTLHFRLVGTDYGDFAGARFSGSFRGREFLEYHLAIASQLVNG
jgi:hypothetical protein